MQDVLACVACLWCVKCDLPCWYPLAALPDLSEELGKRSKQSSSLEVKFKNAQKLSQRLVLACQETIVGTVSTLKRLQVCCLSPVTQLRFRLTRTVCWVCWVYPAPQQPSFARVVQEAARNVGSLGASGGAPSSPYVFLWPLLFPVLVV